MKSIDGFGRFEGLTFIDGSGPNGASGARGANGANDASDANGDREDIGAMGGNGASGSIGAKSSDGPFLAVSSKKANLATHKQKDYSRFKYLLGFVGGRNIGGKPA